MTIFSKMSFLFNKFSPKKMPARKLSLSMGKPLKNARDWEELSSEMGPIKICLNGQETVFSNGEWTPESGPNSGAHKENLQLRKSIQELQDENNLLKVKADILLDMLTQTTAESHLQEKEIERLKRRTNSTKPSARRKL